MTADRRTEQIKTQRPCNHSSPLQREVDVELLAFMERYVTSPLRWDLILFFGQNPHTRDTADNIARRIGRSQRIVAIELDDLVMLGLLEKLKLNSEIAYRLNENHSRQQAVVKLATHCAHIYRGVM